MNVSNDGGTRIAKGIMRGNRKGCYRRVSGCMLLSSWLLVLCI